MVDSDHNDEWAQYLNQRPLDLKRREIRLLKLLPSKSNNDPITFGLVHYELPTEFIPDGYASPYYALSYIWGPSGESHSILIDGISVRVRTNLWRFLHGLRKEILNLSLAPGLTQAVTETQSDSSRRHGSESQVKADLDSVTGTQHETFHIDEVLNGLLWADFLCVNQSNLVERNSQVTMMASIFQQASAVIGWLAGSESRQAASEMRTALNNPHYRDSVKARRQHDAKWLSKSQEPRFFRYGGHPSSEEETELGYMLRDIQESCSERFCRNLQLALAVLATNLYWTRLWIVQEIVLARSFWMLCQDVFLRWDDYTSFTRYLSDVSDRKRVEDFEEAQLIEEFDSRRELSLSQLSHPESFGRKSLKNLRSDDDFWYKQATGRNQSINEIRTSLVDHNHSLSPETLISSIFQLVSCGEPRDRVYGMLGMIRPASSRLIRVDYGKPLLEVYFEGCIALMESTAAIGDFFHVLERLFHVTGPATVHPASKEIVMDSKVATFPSSLDLSFIQTAQGPTLTSRKLPRKVLMIEKLVMVLRRNNYFVVRAPKDRRPEERPLCYTYLLLISGGYKHSEAIVFASFEILVGDLFHEVTDDSTSSIVTRPNPREPRDFDTLGTAFTPRHKVIKNIGKDYTFDIPWIRQQSVPNPIRWMRNRIPGVLQKIHLKEVYPQELFVITLNAAAVMDHMENVMLARCSDELPQVRIGRELGSLAEPVDSP